MVYYILTLLTNAKEGEFLYKNESNRLKIIQSYLR